MGILNVFDKFTDTIFYKKDSELAYQVEVFKKLQKNYPNNYELEKKLKTSQLGLIGENEIEYELKNANIGMYVLRDVNLKYKDLTAQIDYIIITPGFLYFVECKNLIGNITVNERGEFIREYQIGKKTIKEGIYSPIRQSERHVELFKKIYKKRNNTLLDKIFFENRTSWYKPIVVMANSKNILNVKKAPKDIKNRIIKSDQLIDYIKKDISSIDKDLLSNQKVMKNFAFSIMDNYNVEIERDYEKELKEWLITQDNKKENDDLKNKLIDFRKKRSIEKNIPAYYVFNNEELEKILKLSPKTIEELKKSKILSDVKLKLHGEEIIKILNN